jgi:hypothetical protein
MACLTAIYGYSKFLTALNEKRFATIWGKNKNGVETLQICTGL